MSLHSQKFNCEYLVKHIECLSKTYTYVVGTGPFAKLKLQNMYIEPSSSLTEYIYTP